MKSRSLILFVIASICVQFVVGQDLGTAEPVSKTVVVDSKELVLNVSTGSMEDYEERKGPFNVRIGVCGISVTGYAFDPSVEFAKEYNTTVEKLYSFLRSKTKPSLRFDINDFNGSGGSITNVASITSIIATNMSITYFGKDAEGNDYSKEFKCNPKFGSAGDGKFNISMGIDGENVPRNFELTSSSDTTDPSPTASGLSYRALSMLIFVSMPICIAIAFSAIISCWIYCCWDFKQKEAAYAKEEAAEVAAKEKAAAKPKSPTKKSTERNRLEAMIETWKLKGTKVIWRLTMTVKERRRKSRELKTLLWLLILILLLQKLSPSSLVFGVKIRSLPSLKSRWAVLKVTLRSRTSLKSRWAVLKVTLRSLAFHKKS